jgi:site-specific DNA recombinase
MRKKRVFIYIRVSTIEQAEEGYSLSEQEERLIKYCEAMGWEVIKVYIDPGYSGGNMDRPGLKEMISEIEKGNADIVLVDKLDRLSRSQFDTLYMIQKIFNEHDCAFVSRAEALDTSSSFGKAMLGILSVFAELERERIKERMKEGKHGRAKEGKYRGGAYYPTGYDYNEETGFLEINEYDAMQVREVFKLFNQRTPIYSIMNIMNEQGFTTSIGKGKGKGKWNETRIRKMLDNQTYIGKLKYLDEWVDGGHPPIIDMKTWERAQEILAEREKANEHMKQGRRYKSPLGGLPWCACCGSRYHYRQGGKNKDGSVRAYYICYSREKSNKEMIKDANCKNKTYRDRDLEKIILGEVFKLKTNPEYISQIHTSVDESEKAKMIEKQLGDIKKQISNLMDLYSLGTINMNDIKEKIEPLNEKRTALEGTLEKLKSNTFRKDKQEVFNMVDELKTAIDEKDSYTVNIMLNELIEKIIIDNEDIIIHWNF